jgi:hypothetical protein
MKISINKYFEISSKLSNKTKEDFEKYKKEINPKIKNKEELIKIYLEKIETKNINVFTTLKKINNIIKISTFLLSFLLGILLSKQTLNINIYLLISIVIPFVLTNISFIKLYTYKYPKKEEHSLLSKIIKRINKDYNSKDNHIIKLYSFKIVQILNLSYMTGMLLAMLTMFFLTSITFNFESTYKSIETIEHYIINFFSYPYAWVLPEAVPNIEIINKTGLKENLNYNGVWASFIMITMIVWVIIPRILLLIYANFKLMKTIKTRYFNLTKDFYKIMLEQVEIKKNEEKNKENKEYKENSIEEKNKNNSKNINNKTEYFELFYEMEKEEIEIIKENKYLKEEIKNKIKKVKKYTIGLFEEEEKDKKTLKELYNLIIIYTPPESLPDETFKELINKLIKNDKIAQVWIIPLTETEKGEYIFSIKGDYKYNEWENQINIEINNSKIRLFNER